jgi:N-methylhydantoinase A
VSPDGELHLIKVRSQPEKPALACFEALGRVAGGDAIDVSSLVLGTTIATNALLQRAGDPAIFVTTSGFEDVLFIQRIDRRGPYNLQWRKPRPYVERRHCIGVAERIDADGGIVCKLTEAAIEEAVRAVGLALAETPTAGIAVSLLFSYVNPEHERLLAERFREVFPHAPLSVSSDVAPIWREYERGNTTVVDVSVKRTVGGFAASLDDGLRERGVHGAKALMKSNGGQVQLKHADHRPSQLLLSGLAAGMIAGDYFARSVGSSRAVTLDMGGTSADVGVVTAGGLRHAGHVEIEWGLPVALPIIDVTTIGAGGSSIAWVDSGGFLRVGPRSAGADPGPASYGRGGEQPTVTDANLVAGRIDPGFFLGGELPLHPYEAERALQRLMEPVGVDIAGAADAILSVAIENMAGAIRLVTVDRGYDYRDFDLVAFGGAGPLHAAEIVRRMGMRRVIVPPSPGLVSAFGTLIADERVDQRLTMVRRLDRNEATDLAFELRRLAAAASAELIGQRHDGRDHDVVIETVVACRYSGQNYEQEISIGPDEDAFLSQLVGRFHESHEQTYGYSMEDQPVESVSIAATAIIPVAPPSLLPYATKNRRRRSKEAKREILVGPSETAVATVARRSDMPPGKIIEGPALLEESDSTTYVPPGFRATIHESHCLLLEQDSPSLG